MRQRPQPRLDGVNEAAFRGVRIGVALLLVWAGVSVVRAHVDGRRRPGRDTKLGSKDVRVRGPRGTILDRDGRPLARSVLSYDVTVECYGNESLPDEIATKALAALARDRAVTAAEAARVRALFELPAAGRRTDLHERDAARRARAGEKGRKSRQKARRRPWRYYWKRVLAKDVHAADGLRALRELARARYRGCRFRLTFVPQWRRVYPLGRTAAHVVGMSASDDAGRAVRTGFEAMPVLDDNDDFGFRMLRNARGDCFADGLGVLPVTADIDVARVTTTLDANLQEEAHRLVAGAVRVAQADWGFLTVVDLETGDIHALAGSPSFEPEFRKEGEKYWPMTHHALFEPGSVIKPLVIGLALERGIVRPGQEVRCRGESGRSWRMRSEFSRGSRRIVDDHYVGDATLEDLVIQSSNIGAVRVGRRGGPDLHRELLRLFRLADPPLLGLPLPLFADGSPQGGIVPPERRLAKMREYDLYTGPSLSFGYELNVYPLTFAAAFATVITGHRFTLRLVRELRQAGRRPRSLPVAGRGRRVFSQATVDWMRDTLARVVIDPRGTGKHIAGPGVSGVIGGKTGTSVLEPNRRRKDRICTASFAGFTPIEEPRWLALAVVQKRNVARFYGGKFAAPAVRDVLLYVRARDEDRRRASQDAGRLAPSPRPLGGGRAGQARQGRTRRPGAAASVRTEGTDARLREDREPDAARAGAANGERRGADGGPD